MTNKEWLATLSEEDFANWLYSERTRTYDLEHNKMVVFAPNYSPCLQEVVIGWTNYHQRLVMWLKEERKEEVLK